MAVQNLNGRNEHIVINKEKLLKEQIEFNAFDDADIMNNVAKKLIDLENDLCSGLREYL